MNNTDEAHVADRPIPGEVFGSITLVHGDCMDYMRGLPDNAFDLAVVDPPYGSGNQQVGKFGGVNGSVSEADSPGSSGVSRTGGKWAAKYGKKS